MAGKIRKSNLHQDVKTMVTDMISEQALDSANFDSVLSSKTTDDITEGSTNQYYTSTRADSDFDARLATKTTGDISEGSNLYYTDARADARIAAATTADLTEGSNLYYTTARGDSDTGVYISGDRSYGNITTTGYIRGPSTFYIDPAPVDSDAGLLVIRGDLQVDGTTTTVNSTTVSINDKNIVLADSAANASEADGAGITVNGASATITYDAANDEWDFNKDINVTGNITVSGTVDGRDVATDGTKLDGIESGATADQTASEILTSIKTVDGSGSGLDADTLDGVEGSSYLRSDAIDTFTGQYLSLNSTGYLRTDNSGYFTAQSGGSGFQFYNGAYNTVRMHISDTGNVGIGTSSPAYDLDVREGIIFAGRLVSDAGSISTQHTAAIFSSRGVDQDAAETNVIRLMRDGTSGVQYAGVADFNMSEWESVGVNSRTQLTLNLGHGDLNQLQTADVMTWRSNGNVGIGTTSPDTILHISSAGSPQIRVQDTTNDVRGQFTANDSNVVIGTVSNHSLNFATNNGNQVTLAAANLYPTNNNTSQLGLSNRVWNKIWTTDLVANNKVGIGTTTPAQSLEVVGSAGEVVRLRSMDNTGSNYLSFYHNSGNRQGYVGYGAGSDDRLLLVQEKSDNIEFYHSGSTRMAIKNNGNVGIGTSSPDFLTTISSTTNAITGSSVDVSGLQMKIQNPNNADNQAVGLGFGLSTTHTNIGAAIIHTRENAESVGGMHFATKSAATASTDIPIRMTISKDGNVGIGTTSPNGKLEIRGDFENNKALVIHSTYGSGTQHYIRTHGTQGESLAIYNSSNRVLSINPTYAWLDADRNFSVGHSGNNAQIEIWNNTAQNQTSAQSFAKGNGTKSLILTKRHNSTKDSLMGYFGPMLDFRITNATNTWSGGHIIGVGDPDGSGNHAGGLAFYTNPGGAAGSNVNGVNAGGTNYAAMLMTHDAQIKQPRQVAFFARPPGGQSTNGNTIIGSTWSVTNQGGPGTGSQFSTSGIFTVPTTGWYVIHWTCLVGTVTDSRLDFYLTKNDTEIARSEINGYSTTSYNRSGAVTGVFYLTKSDYIKFGIRADAGSATYGTSTPWGYASGYFLG